MIETYQNIPGIIIFEISNFTFCANLDDVYLIKEIKELKRDETINQLNKGYIRLYNNDIVLIDLAKYFDLPVMDVQPSSRIIIINHFIVEGEMTLRYGFIADKVNEIVTLNYNRNYQILNFTKSKNDGFLEAKILFENRELLLPDFSKIGAFLLENKSKCGN
jgi:chemotaxis signal transduction protein